MATIRKTTAMRLIEIQFHVKLEEVLLSGSLNELVRRFDNQIERSTLSKWRKLLGGGNDRGKA